MTALGAPCIYYGDEVGLSAPGDPHCRGAFPWAEGSAVDRELYAFFREVVHLRRCHAVFRSGSFEVLRLGQDLFGFIRATYREEAVVIMNTGQRPQSVTLPELRGRQPVAQLYPVRLATTTSEDDGRQHVVVPPREAVVFGRVEHAP